MDLITKLHDDMKMALKAGEKDRLGVVRMLLSEAKNADLQNPKKTPEQMVEAYGKKLRGTIEEYVKLGKPDEVAKLRSEMIIVEQYLPKKLGEPETATLIDAFIGANTFTEKQAGQATGMFMKQHGANVDAGIASRLIRERLAGKA